jgi:hypothetical protein
MSYSIIIAVLVTVLALIAGGVFVFLRRPRNDDTEARPFEVAPTKKKRDTVAIIGPVNAGKTVLLYQLAAGVPVDTVMSVKSGSKRCNVAGGEGRSVDVTLVDLPGAPQLKR